MLIDCFLMNNELDMLEFRLTEHDPFTDLFVIIESPKTFSGKKKELFVTNNKERFKKWEHKMHIIVYNDVSRKHGFGLEFASRQFGIQYIRDNLGTFKESYVSAVGDVDEIYKQKEITNLINNFPKDVAVVPRLKHFCYSLKLTRKLEWTPQKRLKIFPYSWMTRFNVDTSSEKDEFKILENLPHIQKHFMGWHLCYFGGEEQILNKISDFSHHNMKKCRDIKNNITLLKERIEQKKDIFDRDYENLYFDNAYKDYPNNLELLKKLNLDAYLVSSTLKKSYRFKFYLIHNGDMDRYNFMMKEFITNGIDKDNVVIIRGPNKEDVSDELHKQSCTNPEKTTKGQTSVTYKHYLAIKDISESNCEMGVIMEDNIEFFGNVMDALERYIKDMDDDWDILFDSDILSDCYPRFNPNKDVNGKSVIRSIPSSPSKGANFVLINSKCIKEIKESFLPYIMHSDHNYNRVINKNRLKSYWAVPYNVHYRKLKSTWK